MLSGGITVPAYTTYTEDDYKYLIEDCEPTVVIVILENSGFSITPTDMLSILKFLALNKLVTLNNIPGLFSTRIDNIAHITLTMMVRSYPLMKSQVQQMVKHPLLDQLVCQLL